MGAVRCGGESPRWAVAPSDDKEKEEGKKKSKKKKKKKFPLNEITFISHCLYVCVCNQFR